VNTPNHLAVPRTDLCAFCKYLSGARPFTIIERGNLVAILVTREQRGAGHVLVAPLAHRETILDLRKDEAAAIMAGISRVARAIDGAFEQPGLSVWQNNGVPAGQTVPHVHFHVAGSRGYGETERGEVPELSVEATDEIGARLRSRLSPPS